MHAISFCVLISTEMCANTHALYMSAVEHCFSFDFQTVALIKFHSPENASGGSSDGSEANSQNVSCTYCTISMLCD